MIPRGSALLESGLSHLHHRAGATPYSDSMRSARNGRIFARLEGKLVVIQPRPVICGASLPPWLDDLVDIVARGNRPWTDGIRSEPFDLRDAWCTQILPALRPPGWVLLEVQVPIGHHTHRHHRARRSWLCHAPSAQRLEGDADVAGDVRPARPLATPRLGELDDAGLERR